MPQRKQRPKVLPLKSFSVFAFNVVVALMLLTSKTPWASFLWASLSTIILWLFGWDFASFFNFHHFPFEFALQKVRRISLAASFSVDGQEWGEMKRAMANLLRQAGIMAGRGLKQKEGDRTQPLKEWHSQRTWQHWLEQTMFKWWNIWLAINLEPHHIIRFFVVY